MMLKRMFFVTRLLASSLSVVYANISLIAGYLDKTATGFALKVNMSQANQDG